tara:strand:- start:18086 stop:18550 length:465 start_codon:yes stop_codon:yes gene_type:complete
MFLSIGPENRLKDTFNAYIDYLNPDKRVVGQIMLSDTILYSINTKDEVNKFLEGSWVNYDKSDLQSYPKKFTFENIIDSEKANLFCFFYDNEFYLDNDTNRRYTKSIFTEVNLGVEISKRSYKSYFILVIMFFIIMVPVILLLKRIIKKSQFNQ